MTKPDDKIAPDYQPNGLLGGFSPIGGLTKREWFAGLAMQGILANPFMSAKAEPMKLTVTDFALFSVQQADALIAELAKKKP